MLARLLVVLSWILSSSGLALGQEPLTDLTLRSITKAPHGQTQPDGWLVLLANVANASQRPVTATLLVTAVGIPEVQSARTITFLPGREQQVEIYVHVPPSLQNSEHVEFETTLYRVENGREVLLDRDGQPMRQRIRLPVVRDPNVVFSALEKEPAYQPNWYWPLREAHSSYEWLVSSRVASGNTRASVSLDAQTLPLNGAAWNEVGLFVISNPSVFEDAAAVEELKHFVNNGGRLWIMLDQVPCHLVRPLLGNGQLCEEFDEIELTEFTVRLPEKTQDLSDKDLNVEIDKPARFKRVQQIGGSVSQFVDDWPAAIWMKVGYGEILLTTLESHAWLVPGTESEDPQQQTDFKTRIWAMPLSTSAHDIRREKPLSTAIDYPLQFVGNPVLPRRLVGLVLFSFVSLLGLLAAGYWKFGEISRFGWYAPLLSIVAGCGLFWGSTWIRRDIAETSAKLQIVHIHENGQSGMVREQGVMHLNSERAMQLVGKVDGVAMADTTVQSGIKRFTTQDFQNWQLSNENWPLGTWRYTSEFAIPVEGLVALGELSNNGLQLAMPAGLPSGWEDPVVSMVPGSPMIASLKNELIITDGSLLAEGDRWIDGTIISDEQQRRMNVYQQFFQPNSRVPIPRRSVLGWTGPWQGSTWSEQGLSQAGAALVSLPIRLLRPEIGKPLLIPAGLVQLTKNVEEMSRTSVYSEVTGKWTSDVALAVKSNLQFVLPAEVVPFAADSMTVQLDIKAPYRTVRMLAHPQGSEPIEIVKLEGPSIPWKGEVTDPRILEDARDGAVNIILEVSDRHDLQPGELSATVVTWQIDSFRASFRGSRISE